MEKKCCEFVQIELEMTQKLVISEITEAVVKLAGMILERRRLVADSGLSSLYLDLNSWPLKLSSILGWRPLILSLTLSLPMLSVCPKENFDGSSNAVDHRTQRTPGQ